MLGMTGARDYTGGIGVTGGMDYTGAKRAERYKRYKGTGGKRRNWIRKIWDKISGR